MHSHLDGADKMSSRERDAWQQSRVKDLWRIFQIMSEFVDGFETLSSLGPCVSIFGSARTKPDHPYYKLAEQVARELVKNKYGVMAVGGTGSVQAAKKGAQEGGGVSVRLNIDIPHEKEANRYVERDKLINCKCFFVRKVRFEKYAQVFIVLPGGFGNLDKLFEP